MEETIKNASKSIIIDRQFTTPSFISIHTYEFTKKMTKCVILQNDLVLFACEGSETVTIHDPFTMNLVAKPMMDCVGIKDITPFGTDWIACIYENKKYIRLIDINTFEVYKTIQTPKPPISISEITHGLLSYLIYCYDDIIRITEVLSNGNTVSQGYSTGRSIKRFCCSKEEPIFYVLMDDSNIMIFRIFRNVYAEREEDDSFSINIERGMFLETGCSPATTVIFPVYNKYLMVYDHKSCKMFYRDYDYSDRTRICMKLERPATIAISPDLSEMIVVHHNAAKPDHLSIKKESLNHQGDRVGFDTFVFDQKKIQFNEVVFLPSRHILLLNGKELHLLKVKDAGITTYNIPRDMLASNEDWRRFNNICLAARYIFPNNTFYQWNSFFHNFRRETTTHIDFSHGLIIDDLLNNILDIYPHLTTISINNHYNKLSAETVKRVETLQFNVFLTYLKKTTIPRLMPAYLELERDFDAFSKSKSAEGDPNPFPMI